MQRVEQVTPPPHGGRRGRGGGCMRGRNIQHANALRDQARVLRRTMTPAETILWQHLRGNLFAGLHFRRQQVIDGFIVDFCCLASHLVVEVDGSIHDFQVEYDAERDRILGARGLRVLRFPNNRIMQDLPACLAEIRTAADRPIPDPSARKRGRGDSS